MKKYGTAIFGIASVAALLAWTLRPAIEKTAPATVLAKSSPSPYVVGAGRVEPVSEEIKIGAELDGRLAAVNVEEGARVRRGQVLARLVNEDFAARVAAAAASVAEREAARDRIVNGARAEERRESEAQVGEAEAVLANARAELERRRGLLGRGAISRTEFDSAEREERVAAARLEAARERSALVKADAREDERRRAEAELAAAKARLAEAQALYEKTFLRSPVEGVVLRKHLRTGESVRAGEQAVVTLGDTARLRVRVDVDETDVAKVRVGQPVFVKAEAYGEEKFAGRVVRIGEILGRKNVRTDEPTERVDKKILETLVDLDPAVRLPVGLRVDAYIQTR
jgi:ABC exporter DevB family membrane fusion protein